MKKIFVGAAYYPELWDESETEKDIARMKEAGVNCVRVGEFAWGRMEPEEGKFDFGWLTRTVEKLRAASIGVVMCTPTCTPPRWLLEKYPETRTVYADGTRTEVFSRCHPCKSSPVMREKNRRIVTELAKAFVLKASKYAIEKGGMTSSLYAVAPFARLVPPEKRTSDEFAKAVEERLNDDMEVFGRPTWAGTRGLEHFAAKREGTTAALLVTDGRFDREAEGKVSPLEALKAFKAANPSSCLHIVSAAYRPEEKAALDELAGVMTCTKTYDLEALMTDDALFSRFLEEVFYKDCTRVSSIEIEDLYFEFDRSDITAESRAKLLKAVELIRARKTGEKLIVAGWTDWTGSDAYNEKLSSRRAEAVKAFFVEKGLPADEIGTVGEGESMKYDNRTKEGRRMNRRVELRFLAQER